MFIVKPLYPGVNPPLRGSDGAIGYDLCAYLPDHPHGVTIDAGTRKLIPLGFAATVPEGTYGRIAPRSGRAVKEGLDIMAGVIDRDYVGEWKVLVLNTDPTLACVVKHGERIAQVILERAVTDEVLVLSAEQSLVETVRGASGFGSTGH